MQQKLDIQSTTGHIIIHADRNFVLTVAENNEKYQIKTHTVTETTCLQAHIT